METAPRLDDLLCFAIYRSSLAMGKVYRPVLEKLNLTYSRYLVMVSLWEIDDQTVSELGERLMLDSGTLTALLKRLEVDGYVRRQRDPQDERRVRVTLTPAGRNLEAEANDVFSQILCACGGDADRLDGLRRDLDALTQRLTAS